MDFKQSIENLEYISKIDLDKSDSYGIIFKILSGTILPHNTVTLMKNTQLFRARHKIDNYKFKTKDEFSYRNDFSNIVDFGRANAPHQSMFYASHSYDAAVFETSSLIRDNIADKKTEELSVGRWFVKENIRLLSLINYPEAVLKSKELQHLDSLLKEDKQYNDPDINWMLKFFSAEFAKKSLGNTNNYKISAAYYNLMQKQLGDSIGGVMYPSVGFEYSELNVALQPRIVDKYLDFNEIGDFYLDFNEEPRKIIQIGNRKL